MAQAPMGAPGAKAGWDDANFRPNGWQFGTFDFCKLGCGPCFLAYLCPDIATALARSEYDGGHCCIECLCTGKVLNYNIVRTGLDIEGNCCTDCCIMNFGCCCGPMKLRNEMSHPARIAQVSLQKMQPQSPWTQEGICGCQKDKDCVLTCCCYPCMMASVRNEMDNSGICVNLCCGLNAVGLRYLVRKTYGIEGTACNDIICGYFCPLCVICQAHAEVKAKGSAIQHRENLKSLAGQHGGQWYGGNEMQQKDAQPAEESKMDAPPA